jgi:hypothetical protein
MGQTQHYPPIPISIPIYEDRICRCIGVLQQLQTLLSDDATLDDVVRMLHNFEQEFGAQAQLESVIQRLVSRHVEQQVAHHQKKSAQRPSATQQH